ncbi:MAG: malto-oligosyltrehalose synthase, partial [Chloroflexi bacterium]|nr:malto-oligosyltrehalose synthase [Chloroflexota bacterium]
VSGTSGYEFVNAVNGLFVDSANRKHLDAVYRQFIRRDVDLPVLINSSKKMIMLISLASEINMLSNQLNRISQKNRLYRDFTLNSLTFAMREVIACLPVYRTYTLPGEPVSDRDRAYIEHAVAEAKRHNPRTADSIFDFIGDTLLLNNRENFPLEDREQLVDFVMKFQQVTGPVMAKALEDTVFYIYNRLASLNEVGGDPEKFGLTVGEFHAQNTARLNRWPHSLLATSTHDTKRSEDVRTRIDVLSELPGEWRGALARWGRMNRGKKRTVEGRPAPDFNDEYLLYQTLLGAWPLDPMGPEEFALFRERIAAYMEKATREAKVHTSWINPSETYDAAMRRFVMEILGAGETAFVQDFRNFQRRTAFYGALNSLSQQLLKLTAPGVPDLYQGTEVWDLSLVDPDNRRPVDFGRRMALLTGLQEQRERADDSMAQIAAGLLETWRDGRIKLFVTQQLLNFRSVNPELFAEGDYLALDPIGPRREMMCAFARSFGEQSLLVVAPRLVVRLTGGADRAPVGAEAWHDTWLPLPHEEEGVRYRNLLTGEVVCVEQRDGVPGLPLATICATLPLAALARAGE